MLTIPRKTTITAATVAPAVLVGIVIASLSTKVSPQPVHFAISGVTQAPSTGTQSSLSTSQRSVITEQEVDTHVTSPPATIAPETSATSPTTESTTVSEPVTDPVPPVTAVNAVLSDWTTPVPDTRPNSVPGGTVRYQYCVYTYSDGSTQQQLYLTKWHWPGVNAMTDPELGCSTANAPAAQ